MSACPFVELVQRMPEMWGPTGLSLAAVSPSSRSLLLLSVTTWHTMLRVCYRSSGLHTALTSSPQSPAMRSQPLQTHSS